jgi:hypothetical protein
MLAPSDSPLLAEAAELVVPKLIDFGVHLFGERLPWGLKEMWVNAVGLPQTHLPLALLCFNVGVELGQLLMVGLAYAVVRLPFARRFLGPARRPALYAVGTVAAYWSWLRIAALAT